MRQTRDIALEELTTTGEPLSVTATRVDAAHSIGDAIAQPRSLAEMPVEQAIKELVGLEATGQVKSQADQLAVHLNARQQELDERATELNAQHADLEQELREARAWLSERTDELNHREQGLNAKEAEIQARQAESLARPSGVAPLEAAPIAIANPAPTQPAVPLLSDSILRRAMTGIGAAADGPYIVPPKTNPTTNVRDRRLWDTEWAERERALERARHQLERRRRALEEFWEESSRSRHEALELRLLAEELLAQLKAALDMAGVEEALGMVRQRLANRYRGAADELGGQQYRLDWLKSDLEAEQERLEHRYEELKSRIEVQRRVQDSERSRLIAGGYPLGAARAGAAHL